MARIFIDGFESGGVDLCDANSNATAVSSSGLDMDGDYCLDLNNSTEYYQKNITLDDEMYFAFLYRPTNSTISEQIISVNKDGTPLLHICRFSATGIVTAYLGQFTVLSSSTQSLDIDTTYLIEVHLKVANSDGRVEVKVDGVQCIDYTGDTQVGADTQFNQVRLGYGPSSTFSAYAYFDNLIMDDADWIGDTKIQAILPTGAGTTTGWTPSAGDNYACVDERPASDADYVSIDAVDTTDTYAAGNLSGNIDSIKCVQVQSRTRYDGSPTPTNLKLVIRSGGTDYLSGDKAVPASEQALYNLWETDPDTAAAWLEAGVNAAEIGIKSAA